MQLGLVYLGLLLLIGACYLYMRYSLKQMNTKIIGILELTNTLAQEMEEINKVSNFLGRARDESSDIVQGGSSVDYNGPRLQMISDDEDEDDESDDSDDDGEDGDGGEDGDDGDADVDVRGVRALVAEDINAEMEENAEIDEIQSSVLEENIESLIIEGMIEEKTDVDKMTVSALKLKIKEKDPSIKLTNLKRNDLLNILKNE